ncbi:hypothetical protein [Streptomyces sp. CL12-4]|uniref:hypothetical protein n=1 Tax=Streptomyces sp. CL12-4 TaxID=2810306 RepID=UPI001EFAF00E|nr:hypothetical protein [Streptomyces sp. CL12-4]MCG8971711.1 hypothetical protein [Streptomyces sp. CL12-4]
MVVLPEPYRSFVAEIANGTGDGPPEEGGLPALGAKPDSWTVWEAECWMSPEPFDGTAARLPGQPFPLEEAWEWEYDYYDHALHSAPLHQTYQHGSVLLGTDGAGEYWLLVVTGPHAAGCGGSETAAPPPMPATRPVSRRATSRTGCATGTSGTAGGRLNKPHPLRGVL